jgi:hypothetical protein
LGGNILETGYYRIEEIIRGNNLMQEFRRKHVELIHQRSGSHTGLSFGDNRCDGGSWTS